ncbi:hypothetical protein L1887_51137 [Cichorium endivia]|nr:hypothetical protein L1887_51137 [Cichorium endivia]
MNIKDISNLPEKVIEYTAEDVKEHQEFETFLAYLDKAYTRLEEGIELTDEDRQYLLSLEAKKVDRSKLKVAGSFTPSSDKDFKL